MRLVTSYLTQFGNIHLYLDLGPLQILLPLLLLTLQVTIIYQIHADSALIFGGHSRYFVGEGGARAKVAIKVMDRLTLTLLIE